MGMFQQLSAAPALPTGFIPKATAEENHTAAYDWLEKALKMERDNLALPVADRKGPKMMEMALTRACHYENAWFAMRSNFTRTN